ncbi:hypothetical protein CHUAL_003516 [Chamberlinius hualienensis]
MKKFGIFYFLVGLIGFLHGASVSSVQDPPSIPTYTTAYTVTGVIELPYVEIKEPFTAYYDEKTQQSRVDYYDGMAKTFQLANLYAGGLSLKIVPMTNDAVLNQMTCFAINGSAESPVTIQSIFPDLTGFTYSNDEEKDGIQCSKWTKVENNFDKYSKFSFWAAVTDGAPVHYQMKGYDYVFGSHFDKYEIVYLSYDPTPPDSQVFNTNMSCGDFPGPGASHHHLHNPIREFVNSEDSHVHHEFENFKTTHGKVYDNHLENERRKNAFRQNLRLIHSTNRKGLPYQLKVNHFADHTAHELKHLRGKLYSPGYNGGLPFHKEIYRNAAIPDTFDWRIRGAVTPVKDQAICGSCWSFGTAGTIEGSYFLQTGHLLKLSEQSIIDCAWGEGNNGCDGGEDWRAFQWILKNDGVPLDDSYGPYLGEDGYCHAAESDKIAKITGYVNITEGDIEGLRLAIVEHGPISVSIDASHNEFLFYGNGVYYNVACKNTLDGLDHSVLAVGYGTLDGEDYWLIKNSWSTYWGNDGYALMSRRDNNCGVATAATFVNLA